jgi:hypothetical protein
MPTGCLRSTSDKRIRLIDFHGDVSQTFLIDAALHRKVRRHSRGRNVGVPFYIFSRSLLVHVPDRSVSDIKLVTVQGI